MINYLVPFILFLLSQVSVQVGFIQPVTPLGAAFVNTELPSIYTFDFTLTSGLREDGSLRIKFPNYTTLGTPTCFLDVNNVTWNASCQAIATSVYIQPYMELSPDEEVRATVFVTQPVPDLPGYTELFEVSSVSSTDETTAIIFDINPGFGNFVWQPFSTIGRLFVEQLRIGTNATANLQGATNDIEVHIRFNKGFTAKYSRVLVLLDMPWTFGNVTITTDRSPMYSVAVAQGLPIDLYLPAGVQSFNTINQQLLEIYFNETFAAGREFIMTISGIINPMSITTGNIRFFSTDFTGSYVLEANQDIQLFTSENNLDITIGLASGIPLQGPARLYRNTEQYISISFPIDATIDAGSKITYNFSQDSVPVTGTLYISPSLQGLNGTEVIYNYTSNGLILSNLDALAVGSEVYVQMKVLFSKIRPQFFVNVTVTSSENITVKHGESQPIDLTTNANSIVTFFGDSNNEPNVIQTSQSLELYLNLSTTAKIVDGSNSVLTIYSNNLIFGDSQLNCTSNSGITFSSCTFTQTSTYSMIVIKPIPGPATVDMIISGLEITTVSNHESAIYEFYMRLDKDGNGVEYQDLMVFAFVRPQRNVLSSFIQSHIGNIQGNTMDSFPTFLRMFGSQTSLSSIRVRTNQDFILTIYGFNALNNLLGIPDNEPFPCGSNLNIVCNFIQGSPYAVSSYPLDWDRVIITLPEEALNTPFNIYIPQFFDTSANQTYEFMIGTYDKTTLMYNNLQLQDAYVIIPDQDTTFFTSNNATTGLNMDLSNQKAGIMVTSSIPISFATQINPAIPAGQVSYGAATVLVTTWGFWNNQSALANPTTPISTAAEDATVFLSYPTQNDGNMYAVIWPMTTDTQTQNYSLTFQSTYVEMPYSLDIPDYVMYVTDPNGDLYFYNQVINTGRNALSSNKITNFTFNCLDMVQNYLNTYCTIQFTPNAEIDLQTKVKVEFSNAFVTISECSISYTTNNGTVVALDSSTFACDSSLGEIRLAFDLPERLPVAYYNFSFLGLDFLNGSSNGMNFTIYDSDYGYIIEQASIDYYLELQLLEMISLDNLNYQYLNLDSISNLGIQFTLPRDMNTNEVLEFDVGADIQGNNVDTNRLALFLVNADTPDQRINIYGALKNQILQLQFDTGVYLPEGSYILNIDNLRTPTTQLTDKVKIRLRRLTDSVFVLENNYTLFTAYPVLFLGNSAQIELLSSRFLCVGCLGEFVFQVTLTSTYVDATTMLYLHFPSFFLPALTNEAAQLDCSFNTDPVNCYTDSDYPFRLDITGSPLNLKPGDTFNLTIYGIVIPNADEVNSNEEYIFFAISTAQNLSVYSEQTFLALPDLSLIRSGFDPMFFYNLTVSNTTIKVASDHILRVNTSANIPAGSKITVTLTDDYTNLRYSQSLSCQLDLFILGVRSQNYSNSVCPVTGSTIEFDIIKDIPGSYSLELTIHAVPNPPQVVTVDPTEFLIVAFEDDENDIIAISRDSLNSVYLLDFIDPENILQANNNQDIVVTRGTYTQVMTIGTVPGQRFKQDVSITANTTGFTFVPMDLNFYVGDTTSSFRLGCDENVKLRTYPLEFTQNQNTSLVNMYGDLFNVRITVTDTPITIGIPDFLIVPINGYSLPYTILLDQPPFKSMQILIDYDEDLLDGVFGIDEDYSSPDLNFTLDNGIGYFAFYARTGVPTQPFNVTLELDGDNYESYQLNRSTIEIRPQSVTIGPAIVAGSTVQIGKTLAVFSITPATEGMLFYQLSEPCIGAQSLPYIKNLMKNNSFNELEVTQGCYQRYSVQPVDSSEIPVTLNITSLTPETTYNLYVYFENGLKQNNMANILSFTFTTAAMNPIIKMDATFSQRIFIDQLNDFICFLLILFETRAVNVVDAQGYSCSSFVEPTSRFLTFQGESFSNYSYGFSFYLLPDPTVEIDASSLVVPEYFDSTNQANTAFYQAAQNAGINFLESYYIETSFTQEQAFASTGPVVMPTLEGFNEQVSVVELNGTITMANIQLSQPGTVYAFARAIGSIVQDPEDDFAMIDVTTRIPKTPTFDQINNCLDWNNEPADACAKAVLVNADQNIDLQLQGLTPNTAYIVYYAVANEYPIAPIFSSDIDSFTIQVLNANLISYCSTLLIALMLFLLL